jgi:hypothetical protein
MRLPPSTPSNGSRLLPAEGERASSLSVPSAATLIGRSFPAANNAVAQLVNAGVLQQVNVGRRNRAYAAPDIITAFTSLERQLASPEGDTLASKPVRPVPQRR